MKAVAERASSQSFIIETKDGFGHLVNVERNEVSDQHRIQSMLARGYWQEVESEVNAAIAVGMVRSHLGG